MSPYVCLPWTLRRIVFWSWPAELVAVHTYCPASSSFARDNCSIWPPTKYMYTLYVKYCVNCNCQNEITQRKCSWSKIHLGIACDRELTWQDADASAEQVDLPVSSPGDVWRRVRLDVTQQRHHVALDHADLLLLAANYSRRHWKKIQRLCCSEWVTWVWVGSMKEHPMLCTIKEKKDILYIAASDYMET